MTKNHKTQKKERQDKTNSKRSCLMRDQGKRQHKREDKIQNKTSEP